MTADVQEKVCPSDTETKFMKIHIHKTRKKLIRKTAEAKREATGGRNSLLS